MKLVLCVVLFLTVGHHVSASAISKDALYRSRAARLEANINEYFDTLVVQLKTFVIKEGLDPMALPDIVRGFSFKDLVGITWHGELELNDGQLKDLALLQRSGDATMKYDHKLLEIRTEIGFDDLMLNFDFRAQIMNLGPKGKIHANIYDLKILFDVIADLETLDLYLQEMKITDAGRIDVSVESAGLLDIIINAIADVVTLIFHDTIVKVIDTEVRSIVEKALAEIDLGSIIGGGGSS